MINVRSYCVTSLCTRVHFPLHICSNTAKALKKKSLTLLRLSIVKSQREELFLPYVLFTKNYNLRELKQDSSNTYLIQFHLLGPGCFEKNFKKYLSYISLDQDIAQVGNTFNKKR